MIRNRLLTVPPIYFDNSHQLSDIHSADDCRIVHFRDSLVGNCLCGFRSRGAGFKVGKCV